MEVCDVEMTATITVSEATALLADLVRSAQTHGETATITIDGEPDACLVPVPKGPRPLSPAESAGYRALFDGLARIDRPTTEFDAVELVAQGRR